MTIAGFGKMMRNQAREGAARRARSQVSKDLYDGDADDLTYDASESPCALCGQTFPGGSLLYSEHGLTCTPCVSEAEVGDFTPAVVGPMVQALASPIPSGVFLFLAAGLIGGGGRALVAGMLFSFFAFGIGLFTGLYGVEQLRRRPELEDWVAFLGWLGAHGWAALAGFSVSLASVVLFFGA